MEDLVVGETVGIRTGLGTLLTLVTRGRPGLVRTTGVEMTIGTTALSGILEVNGEPCRAGHPCDTRGATTVDSGNSLADRAFNGRSTIEAREVAMFVRGLMVTAAAAAAVLTPIAVAPGSASAAPCSMYIEPFNPWLQTCGIPNNPPVVPGASPGAGAIIACREIPGCLSYVVNGGPGYGFGYGPIRRPNSSVGNGR